jgi:hypothetical protein
MINLLDIWKDIKFIKYLKNYKNNDKVFNNNTIEAII